VVRRAASRLPSAPATATATARIHSFCPRAAFSALASADLSLVNSPLRLSNAPRALVPSALSRCAARSMRTTSALSLRARAQSTHRSLIFCRFYTLPARLYSICRLTTPLLVSFSPRTSTLTLQRYLARLSITTSLTASNINSRFCTGITCFCACLRLLRLCYTARSFTALPLPARHAQAFRKNCGRHMGGIHCTAATHRLRLALSSFRTCSRLPLRAAARKQA